MGLSKCKEISTLIGVIIKYTFFIFIYNPIITKSQDPLSRDFLY